MTLLKLVAMLRGIGDPSGSEKVSAIASALSGLGMILSSLGEKLRAIDAYKQALAVDPHLDKVREAMEALEKETGRDI